MSNKVIEENKQFFLEVPEPGFSPARNKYIVENSIRKHKARKKKIEKEFMEGMGLRADAITSFFAYVNDKGGSKSFEEYVGKNTLLEMQGQRWLEKKKEERRIAKA